MTNTATNETAPWRSPSGKYAVRWVHLSIGWRFWAFERNTGDDVGHFTSKAEAIAACEQLEREADEETETRQIPAETMKQLVFGFQRRPVMKFRLPVRLVFIAALVSTMYGCATGRLVTVDAPETVGNLSASYHSVAVAPVHASTDLTPSFGAVEGDDTAGEVATTVTRAPDAGEPDALPEVAPKTDGVTTGAAR